MSSGPKTPDGVADQEPQADYEPPAIVWEEAYEPVGFGISCAKQEGNPGCFPGPILT